MKELMSLMIKKKTKKALKRKAKKEQETLSEYVRRILEKHLEQGE